MVHALHPGEFSIWSLRPKVVMMLIVAVVPVVMVVAALFPIVAVGPVVGVMVVLLSSVVDAEAAATQICTNYVVAALLFWAESPHKTLLLIHNCYLLSHGPRTAPW
jgi:hypothetical protein